MLNQLEKDAFLNAFDITPDVSLKKIVTPYYIVLILLFIIAFTVVQIFKSTVLMLVINMTKHIIVLYPKIQMLYMDVNRDRIHTTHMLVITMT